MTGKDGAFTKILNSWEEKQKPRIDILSFRVIPFSFPLIFSTSKTFVVRIGSFAKLFIPEARKIYIKIGKKKRKVRIRYF